MWLSVNDRVSADEEKVSLLRNSRAVLYTPHNEHFGIVPVEAMYLGTPVIAVNSGGPFLQAFATFSMDRSSFIELFEMAIFICV